MLKIDDLSFRIEGRPLFDGASAHISKGWKVGLVGRNGTGKSTLLRLILESEHESDPSIRMNARAKLGHVAQEAAPSETLLLDEVLAADTERASLLTEAETATDPDRIAEIYERLTDIDAYSAESRAAEILTGLGFTQADLSRPLSVFSGGWRMRAALAGVLFAQPDLLLLDEPTNYLDLEGAAWLERYLRRYPHTVVIVSHDRELLNRSVTHIMALQDLGLSIHVGGYDAYLRKRAERAAQAEAMKVKQDREKAHMQAFVDRFRYKASKARQAQSRLKMLEKMQDISVPLADRTQPFSFGEPEELASPLFVLEQADMGYAPGEPVLEAVNLRIDQDDRVAIVGANGQGKSTLVKSIAAKLPLLEGDRKASRGIRIGYFSQDQLDELHEGDNALDHIRDMMPDASESKRRSIAAQIGFDRAKSETNVEALSGGEKVRLLLGLTGLTKPHILILDEPTSHLDIDSREALIHALNEYTGAVLLITHDVFLAEATADRIWLVKDSHAAPFDGDLREYRKLVLTADKSAPPPERKAKAEKSTPKETKPTRSPSTLKRVIEKAEIRMRDAKQGIADIDATLADPAIFTDDPARAATLAKQREELTKDGEVAAEEWMTASEEYDEASA